MSLRFEWHQMQAIKAVTVTSSIKVTLANRAWEVEFVTARVRRGFQRMARAFRGLGYNSTVLVMLFHQTVQRSRVLDPIR